MKKLYVFVIGLLLWANVGFTQCSMETFNLGTQAEVDNFAANHPGCTTVGGLRIEGRISNLNGLSQITSVLGNLSIDCFYYDENDNFELKFPLTSLSGLNNLTHVGGDLALLDIQNANTSNLFPNLQVVGRRLIFENRMPAVVGGFNNVTNLGCLIVIRTDNLVSLQGFSSLQQITNPVDFSVPVEVTANESLVSMPNFPNLTTINAEFYITNNPSLTQIGFTSLQIVSGNFRIITNNALTQLGLGNLASVGAEFRIADHALLTDISGLSDFSDAQQLVISNNLLLAACDIPSICGFAALHPDRLYVQGNAVGCFSNTQLLVACGMPQNCNGITLSTQEEIDNFPINYNCSAITGTLTISGNDITNLNGLTSITSVENISIYGVPNLTNYSGLNNVQAVTGNFSISGITASNISGFSSLATVGGNFNVTSNENLVSLTGFGLLQQVSGAFNFYNNNVLTSLPNFSSLTTIGYYLGIDNNPVLTSIAGLQQLTAVNNGISVTNNPLLTTLNGLGSLTTINGALTIYNNNTLSNISAIANINPATIGTVYIGYCPQLSVCSQSNICSLVNAGSVPFYISGNALGCENTTQILVACGSPQNCGNISLSTQQDVDNFPINYGCSVISGRLSISGNNITNLNGLSQITSVGALDFNANPLLTNFTGLSQLTTINGDFELHGQTAANVNLNFPALTTIAGRVIISNCNTVSINGFTNLETVGGDFAIYNNDNLTNCTAFGNLQSIGGSYDLFNNPALAALPTTNSLTSVGGYLRLTNNANVSLSGLNALISIGASFQIYSNPVLSNLSALMHFTTMSGQIYIADNPALMSLSGLDNINPAGITVLSIYTNNQLSTCSVPGICSFVENGGYTQLSGNAIRCQTTAQILVACNHPQNCTDVYLYSQADVDNYYANYGCTTITGNLFVTGSDITNLNGLSQITSVGKLTLTNLPALQNTGGINNITMITGDFELSGDMPASLGLLPNLTSVGGNFYVFSPWYNTTTQLASLTGFTSLSGIGGNLNITGNPHLTQLPVFQNLTSIGSLNIETNALLTNINALAYVTTISGAVNITSNPKLTSIAGLNQLNAAGISSLQIYNNPLLSVCNAVSVCDYLGASGQAFVGANAAGCFNVGEVVSACTNQLPIFGYVSSVISFCAPSQATIYLAGLFPYSVSTIGYHIANGQGQTANSVVADIYGSASFPVFLDASNNGQMLYIDTITRTDVSGQTLTVTQNNEVTLIQSQANTYYRDADGDGYGNALLTIAACSAPLGYVSNPSDCDDTDNEKYHLYTFYADADDDGFGGQTPSSFCTNSPSVPEGFSEYNSDCDDNNAALHEPRLFYVDADHDGFGTAATAVFCQTTPPMGYALISGDCNDNDATINPSAQHIEFSGAPNFTTAVMAPLTGTIYSTFSFEITYFDANNNLPQSTFPRVYLDYEGNGYLSDANDRVVSMMPYDVNDLNTIDGKRYIATINTLPYGTNWQTRVQVANGGCLTQFGPFNYPDITIAPDLQIFANDIILSSNHPAVSSPLTVSAVIHNASDHPAHNFYAQLVNQYDPGIVYADILIPDLAQHSSTTITWNIITPAVPAWCPMQVIIDSGDAVVESNEYNNSAVRPFINGNYNLLGGMDVIEEAVSPAVSYASPESYMTVTGAGRYYDELRQLPDDIVSGATVTVRIVETGQTGFAYTTSSGDFFCTVRAPETPGIYHIEGEMTDFTFTAYFNLTFEKITPIITCPIDLNASIYPTSATIIQGESVSGTVTVSNHCATISAATQLRFSQDAGNPVYGNVSVPPLGSYDSFTTTFDNIVFNTPGTYSICATADGDYEISESNESNNTGCMIVTVLPNQPDIYAASGPSGLVCGAAPSTFSIGNSGGVPTGAFQCDIIVKRDEVEVEVLHESVENIAAFNNYGFSRTINYNVPGNYTFELRCDVPHPNGTIIETNESNNIGHFGTVVRRADSPDIAIINAAPGSQFLCEANGMVSFALWNQGCIDTASFNCDIAVKRNGVLVDTLHETVANIPGDSQYSFSKPFIYTSVGNYTFELQCDVTESVTEIDENNNSNTYYVTINACKPNLTFDRACELFDVQPVDPQYPGFVTYTATVTNNGNAAANGPIGVRFELSGGQFYDTQYAGDLAPGATAVVTVNVPSVAPATQELSVIVDYNNLIDEFSEDDNEIHDSLCWDFVPVPRPDVCGDDFWEFSYLRNQEVPVSVAFNQLHLYDASAVEVKFEVSGPGLTGTVDLGTVSVPNIEQNCACPYVAALPYGFVIPEVGTYTFTMTVDPNHVYTECDETNNVLIRSIQATILPDMRVLSQYINPSLLNPDPGQPITLDITYENVGESNVGDSMTLKVYVDAEPLYTTQVGGLASGTNATIHLPVTWSSALVGTHIIRSVIDSSNAIDESDEANNSATRAVIVGEASNLYFESFASSNISPNYNDAIVFTAVVANNGDLRCQAEVVFYYINDQSQEVTIGTALIDLAEDGLVTVEMPWTVADDDTTVFAKIVNPSTLEFNDFDNIASVRIGKTIVNLKLFIAGYYSGDQLMAPVKRNQGVENAADNEVEDLTIEFYNQQTLQLMTTATATLHTDGLLNCMIRRLDAACYIAIKGNNFIQTWSASPQLFDKPELSYDFTTAASKAYGNNQQEVEPGVWAIFSGDINQDGGIDLIDYSQWETDFNEFAFGAYITDLNGDGSVDLIDYSIWESNSNNFIYAIYPMP